MHIFFEIEFFGTFVCLHGEGGVGQNYTPGFVYVPYLYSFFSQGCQLVITNTDGALRKHIVKFHHNQNICETCGKVFTDLRLFDVHVKSAHTDVKDHFCDRCGKVIYFIAHTTKI